MLPLAQAPLNMGRVAAEELKLKITALDNPILGEQLWATVLG